MSLRALAAWLLLTLVVLGLRVGAGWPGGVDRDENQDCWNARCLAAGGTDFRGNRWPLILEDYGDDKHALYAWMLAGFERAGVTIRPERARWFSALLLALGSLLFGIALALRTESRTVGFVGLLCFGLLPWFQVGPCLAWECATSPPAYAAMFCGLALVGRRSGLGWTLFFAGFVVGIYGYPAPKVLAPILLAAAALLFARGWRSRVAVFGVGSLLALPLLLAHLDDASTTDRAAHILVGSVSAFLAHWRSYWAPSFLLLHGDSLPRHFAGFLGVLPFALLGAALWNGVAALAHGRMWPQRALDRYALVALLVFPLPAALTDDGSGHVLRSLLGGVAWAWFGTLGLAAILAKRSLVGRVLIGLVLAQCLTNLVWIRFVWRNAQTTRDVFHGTFYSDLRAAIVPRRPARVFFSPLPMPLTSAFPFIHFGWTALDSQPIPGQIDAVVTRFAAGVPHLATTGSPRVGVWIGQAATTAGADLVIQIDSVAGPIGFERIAGLNPPMALWLRPKAQR